MNYTKLYLKRIRRSIFLLGGCLVAVIVFMYYLSDMIVELEDHLPKDGETAVDPDGYVGREEGGGVTVVSPE